MRTATAVFFISLALLLPLAYGQQLTTINYTQSQANTIIKNATNYVSQINQSGYLIFYPDLKQAYASLNRSMFLYSHGAYSASVPYANQAVYYATLAYQNIGVYRYLGFAIVIAFTAAVGFALYKLMKPTKAKKGR